VVDAQGDGLFFLVGQIVQNVGGYSGKVLSTTN
jgi:hypothetical protein